MPRFYFHLHECGTIVTDEEGCDGADLAQARAIAVRAARDVMCGEVTAGKLCLGCAIVIADEGGDEVACVPFRDALQLSGL